MDIGKIDIGKIEAFLSNLGKYAGVAQTAADNAPVLGDRLLNYVIGSSSTSKSGFDGILAGLSNWSGDAADAFKAQAQTVRSFGIGVATLSDMTVQPQTTAQEQQYEAGYLTDYNGAATTLNQVFADISGKYHAATSGPNSFQSWTSYMAQFLRAAWQNNQPETQISMTVPTFAEFANGSRVNVSTDDNGGTVYNTSGPGKPSGVLTVYTNPSVWGNDTSHFTYQNPEYGSGFQITVVWNVWAWESGPKDSDNQNHISQWTQDSEYNNYLRKLMVDLGNQYPLVQAPPPQSNSVLPKTNGSASSSSSGPGGYGGGYGSGFGAPGTGGAFGTGTNGGFPGSGSGSPNGGSYNPGSYSPGGSSGQGGGGYNPGSYNPGSYTGGSGVPGSNAGWNPTQLAGYNPNPGGGLGPGSTGFAGGGPGALGGAGGGAGGTFPGGTGAGSAGGGPAAEAGLAGAAGRGMPMAPMGGMGGGKEGKERQRAAWLTEDEDVWGAGDDGGDAVL